jgi:hypothetical protein
LAQVEERLASLPGGRHGRLGRRPPSTAPLPHSPRRRLAQPPGKARVVAGGGGSSSLAREGLRLERLVALDDVRLTAECTPGRRPRASSAEVGGCGGCAGSAAAGAAASSEVGAAGHAVRSGPELAGSGPCGPEQASAAGCGAGHRLGAGAAAPDHGVFGRRLWVASPRGRRWIRSPWRRIWRVGLWSGRRPAGLGLAQILARRHRLQWPWSQAASSSARRFRFSEGCVCARAREEAGAAAPD